MGIGIAVAVCVALVAIAVCVCMYRRNKQQQQLTSVTKADGGGVTMSKTDPEALDVHGAVEMSPGAASMDSASVDHGI